MGSDFPDAHRLCPGGLWEPQVEVKLQLVTLPLQHSDFLSQFSDSRQLRVEVQTLSFW